MRGKFISGYLTDIKHMPAWIILLIFILMLKSSVTLAANNFERLNRAVFKVNSSNKPTLFSFLEKNEFRLLHEITPSVYIFEYDSNQGNKKLQEALQTVLETFPNEIVSAEPGRNYKNDLQPWDPGTSNVETFENLPVSESNVDSNVGMGVSKAWSRGYTGKGVTIAVTGVGIETQLLDLKNNMNPDLNFNYVYNKTDITPEIFQNSQRKALLYTDHGNRVAGLLAAEKGNNICSAGIAYNSKIVGIKMFAVRIVNEPPQEPVPSHLTAADVVSRALTHRLDDIDVYVNAWTPSKRFDNLDLATREAIEYGAKMGRRGLGAVYIVPAGPAGSLLSNNIYTITVGMLGANGTIRSGSVMDASILTSGLGDGNSLTSSNTITTSHKNKCVTSFKGYSAAVSQVGGIIALALQANPSLTSRDIQHLLVKASSNRGLHTTTDFKINGAGLYFHETFGFGLLDAEKMVSLSKERTPVPVLMTKTLQPLETRNVNAFTKTVEFCYSCDVSTDSNCLTTVEHVTISLRVDRSLDNTKIDLLSPSGTRSLLIDFQENQVKSSTNKEATLVSANFWDEAAFGVWTLAIQTKQSDSEVHLIASSLTLHGTQNLTFAAGRKPVNRLCAGDQTVKIRTAAVKTTPVESSPTKTSETENGKKLSVPVIVILPLGVVIMCGILAFIFMKGGSHVPISSYGKPIKKKVRQEPIHRHRVNDSPLHRQVSLLRQISIQESTAEDIEGEEAELNRQI